VDGRIKRYLIIPVVLILGLTAMFFGCKPDILLESIEVILEASPPYFNLSPGVFTSDQALEILCELDEITIYYTLDGTDPTTDSLVYTGPIEIAGNGTEVKIHAMAVAENMTDSIIIKGTFIIQYTSVQPPSFSSDADGSGVPGDPNSATGPITVTLTPQAAGSTLYYTTDGSLPSADSTLYTAPFIINSSSIVSAVAYMEGMAPSTVVSSQYTIVYPTVDPPVIGLAGPAADGFDPMRPAIVDANTFYADDTVQISSGFIGALKLFYTTDGSAPEYDAGYTATGSTIEHTGTSTTFGITIPVNPLDVKVIPINAVAVDTTGSTDPSPVMFRYFNLEFPRPEIALERNSNPVPEGTTIDYPLTYSNETTTYQFVVKNEHADDLVISNVSCDDTSFILTGSSLPITVTPFSQVTIDIAFEPTDPEIKNKEGTLTITNNDTTHNEASYTFTVRGSTDLQPSDIWDELLWSKGDRDFPDDAYDTNTWAE